MFKNPSGQWNSPGSINGPGQAHIIYGSVRACEEWTDESVSESHVCRPDKA